MKTNVKFTSILSHDKVMNNGSAETRRQEVYQCFLTHGDHTDLEVSRLIGMPINVVTARRNELVKYKKIVYKQIKRISVFNDTILSDIKSMVWGIPDKVVIIEPIKDIEPIKAVRIDNLKQDDIKEVEISRDDWFKQHPELALLKDL